MSKGKQKGQRGQIRQKGSQFLPYLPSLPFLLPLFHRFNHSLRKVLTSAPTPTNSPLTPTNMIAPNRPFCFGDQRHSRPAQARRVVFQGLRKMTGQLLHLSARTRCRWSLRFQVSYLTLLLRRTNRSGPGERERPPLTFQHNRPSRVEAHKPFRHNPPTVQVA